MKRFFTLFLLAALPALAEDAASHVKFDMLPKDNQIFPRDLRINKGKVTISGKVTQKGYHQIKLIVSREGNKLHTGTKDLTYKGDEAAFNFSGKMDAGLFNHEIEVLLVRPPGVEEAVTKIKNLACGDVFVINGQSNAEARSFRGDANVNQHEFLRSFGSRVHNSGVANDLVWHKADGNRNTGPGAVGQWGLRMGRLILDEKKIPVAVINGALGGQPIQHFTRNEKKRDDLGTNYGRLLYRCRQAGVVDGVRSILWYQGESDKGAADRHITGFEKLFQNWLEDFPGLERVYVNQLRTGCGVDKWNVDLRDRQRRLPERFPKISVMSTTGIDAHDGCHYSYKDGYEILGNRLAALMLRDLYGMKQAAKNLEAPNVERAWFSKPDKTEVTIKVKQRDFLVWNDGAKGDFRFEGSDAKIASVRVLGNQLICTLSGPADGATGVTYSGHAKAGPWVTNKGGIGMLTFWNVPIAPRR